MTPEGQKRREANVAATSPSGRGAGGSIIAGALYHIRLAAADCGISKLLSDCPDPNCGGIHDGDDSRCAIIPLDGRPHLPPAVQSVAGGLARPLGRRYAGRRYDELQTAKLHGRVQREASRDRALHPHWPGEPEIRNHDRRSRDMDETMEPDDPLEALAEARSTSTPATRATSAWWVSSPEPVQRSRPPPGLKTQDGSKSKARREAISVYPQPSPEPHSRMRHPCRHQARR